ncbi:MAG: hypothetical protein NTV01_09310 [Bacteroidia bacterium]|nr:hypothetical protein [Bacteroidia bacterium]
MNMVIGVPLKFIQPAGLVALDNMVIGLRFGQSPAGSAMEGRRPQISGGSQQPVSSGSGAGSGGGGGGRGGRGGGGRGGSGGGGGGNAGGGQMNAGGGGGQGGMDNSPVEFWYKTKLAKR